jgi:hypothetical protein
VVDLAEGCEKGRLPVMAVKWMGEGLLVAACAEGKVVIVEAGGGVRVEAVEEGNYTMAVDTCLEAGSFASCGKDCSIRLYSAEGRLARQLRGVNWHLSGHNNRLFSLKYVDERCLMSGGWDQTVHLWDVRAGVSSGSLCGPRVCGDTLDYRDNLILTGSYRP